MSKKRRAISIGKFECLHRGHQKLLGNIIGQKYNGMESTVITIDFPGKEKILLENERRELLRIMQIDSCISMVLNEELQGMDAEKFVKKILVDQLNVGYLTAGKDFRFGKDRKGDGNLLTTLGKAYDFQVVLAEKEKEEGKEISNSWVKEEIVKGNISLANKLLGYHYYVSGEVCHGNEIGRVLGFPTVNLRIDERKVVPPRGVYFSIVMLGGKEYNGITNIGYRPTIDEKGKVLVAETYIYNFHEDVYGKTIRVGLCDFVRPEQKFANIELLKTQIYKDMEAGKRYFATRNPYK